MRRKLIFILIATFSIFLPVFSFSQADAPDTSIVNPPESEINYNDLRIWWISKTESLDTQKGYYYQLDNGKYEFTEKNYATLHKLADGAHTLRVKAIDENLVEDSSPAACNFNVSNEIYQEPEGFNNASEHAVAIDCNKTVEGTTETVSDIDWYQFQIPQQTEVVNLLMRREPGSSDTKIKIYQGFVSSSTLISEFRVNSSNKERNCLTFGVKEEQDYYVKIEPRSFDPDIKKYYLTVNATPSVGEIAWDTESNNSPEYANKLQVSDNTVQNFGFANMNGVVDWYKIHVDSPKMLKMSISRNSATLTPTSVSLYSSPSAGEESLIGSPSTGIFQTAVTLGDYFLRVETNTLDFETPYLTKFKLDDLPTNQTAEFEPNNLSPLQDPTAASKLPLNTPLIGNNYDGDEDIDWFVIDVPETMSQPLQSTDQTGIPMKLAQAGREPMLCLTISRKGGIGSTSLELYNLSFSKLTEQEITLNNAQKATLASTVDLDGGKHYVKLNPQNESPLTQYKLTAFYFPSAKHNADEPLGLDETLNVQLICEQPIRSLYFDLVGNFRNPEAPRYKSIPMYDDGQHLDGDADDGVYAGQFTPGDGDDVMYASVLMHVATHSGNQVDFYLPEALNIDTEAPEIYSLEHNADAVLITGEELRVKLYGEPNLEAEFDISGFQKGIEMHYIGVGGDVQPPSPPGSSQPTQSSETNGDTEGNYYIGTYTVKSSDCVVNAKIIAWLIDPAGNIATKTSEQPIAIAGDGPKIYSAEHNAVDTSLKLGQTLTVTVETDPNADVKFKIARLDSILMYDDGMHDDGQSHDGIYAGKYEVKSTDELEKVPVSIFVTKLGLSSQVEIADKVTLDGIPPEPVSNVSAVDVPDDQGYNLSVSWEPPALSNGETIAYYNLYTARTPSVVNKEPTQTVAEVAETSVTSTSTSLSVEENATSYYVAVTAVDRAGNESKLGTTSTAGPVQALDNLSPPSVRIISAFDTPHDFGKMITLEWEDLGNIEDLDHYQVYVSETQISKFERQTSEFHRPIITPTYDVSVAADGVDYYFAVTAVDRAGNESDIKDYSVAGPVQSERNIEKVPDQPLQIITGPSGLIRYDDVVFRWTGGLPNYPITQSPIYHYQLDDTVDTTTLSEISFTNLSNGEHKFTLQNGEMEISRSFVVNKTVLSETEPNNTQDTADELPLGFTLTGELSDADYFHFALSNPGWIDISTNRENLSLSLFKNSRKIAENLLQAGVPARGLSTGLGAGDYFILLSPTEELGSYELSAAYYPVTELATFEIEPNESASEATPILVSKPTVGSCLPSEQDWFRLQIDSPGILVADTGALGGLQLTLWNSALTKIIESPLFTASQLSPGNYFISVQNSNTQHAGSFYLAKRTRNTQHATRNTQLYHLTNVLVKSIRMKIKGKQKWWTMEDITAQESPKLTLGDTLVVEMRLQTPGFSRGTFSVGSIQKNRRFVSSDTGIYTGEYQIPDGIQKNDIPIQIELTDTQNNITRFQPFYVDIDTKSSPIISISHNAETPLRKDDTLEITLQAEQNADGVSFKVVAEDTEGKTVVPPTDFSVTADSDGSYIGTYRIQPGDEFVGTAVGKLTRYNGREITKNASTPVKVDAVPPAKLSNLKAEDVPNDQGFVLNVSWDTAVSTDFSHYELYVQREPIGDVESVTPKVDNLKSTNESEKERIEVEVDENDVKLYVAVVAVDQAGNKSAATSTTVSAIDNLVPEPVGVLTGFDTPNDSGGSITLEWTKPSGAPDFDHYNIYSANYPITQLPNYPITQLTTSLLTVDVEGLENDVDYYFAVTAVDQSGNESEISEDSTFGPVSAVDNTTPAVSSISYVVGPEGIIRYDDVQFVWNRWTEGQRLSRYFYRLDDSAENVTTETSITFQNLKDGTHKFSIRGEEDTDYVVRNFTVQKTGVHESEPNDTVPQSVEFNLTYFGQVSALKNGAKEADTDLYSIDKFQAQSSLLFVSLSGGPNCKLRIFNPDSGDLHPLTQGEQSFVTGINPEKQYLIEITGDSENYELVVDELAPGFSQGISYEVEPNDTQDFATQISVPQVELAALPVDVAPGKPLTEFVGNAKNPDDVDWFYITNSGSRLLSLQSYGVEKISVYSSSRSRSRQDFGVKQIAEFTSIPNQTSFAHPEDLHLRLHPDASYFFEVSPKGNYSINLTLQAGVPASDIEISQYELEPNDSKNTATPMTLAKTISGTNWNNEDVDWYKLNVDNSGTLALALYKLVSQGTSYELQILNSDGESLSPQETRWSDGENSYIQADVQTGSYFIQIKPALAPGFSQESSSGYELLAVVLRRAEFSVERKANRPAYVLAEGDLLKVHLETTVGESGTFDIGPLRKEIPMTISEGPPKTYLGEYKIAEGDNATNAQIMVNLQGVDDKLVKVALSPSINVDTKSPTISSVTHDANKALGAGSELHVSLHGDKGMSASFQVIGDDFETVPVELGGSLPDEGEDTNLRRATTSSRGVYTGVYVVSEDDNTKDAKVIATLTDLAMNETQKTADTTVTFDTTPPEISQVTIEPVTQILTHGDKLKVTLTGEPSCLAYFDITGSGSEEPSVVNLRMYDDSKHDDGDAGDGVYVGTYIVKPGDKIEEAVVSCTLKDEAKNQSEMQAFESVTIDTTPPEIQSVEHNADKPLSKDEILRVTVTAEPGAEGTWQIGDFKSNLPLYDDGTHGDEAPNDGVYAGKYLVRAGDDVKDAFLSATLVKENGKSATKSALKKLTIDTDAPEPVTDARVSDVAEDSGFFLMLEWQGSGESDFDHYNVYIANMPITQLDSDPVKIFEGLELKREDDTVSTMLEVEKNDIDYYFAVTAVDLAGNESELILTDNGSSAGPVRALDNLAPPTVKGLEAIDTPDDYGGSITLSWKEPSSASDFDHYNVYLSREPIVEQAVSLLTPITQISNRLIRSINVRTADETDYYLAVTAVDISENESEAAIVGPVQSLNNIGDIVEGPIRITSGPLGQIRQRAVTFHWSPWVGEKLAEFSFKLDSGNYQYTNKNRATFYNLQKGQHKFFLKTLNGEITSRTFNVQPQFIPESEPNNSQSLANSISPSAIVHGETEDDADEDWYLLDVTEVLATSATVAQCSIHFVRSTGIGQSSIELFRDGKVVGGFTVNPETHQRGTVSLGVEAGEYQIRVRGQGENASASYELSVSLQPVYEHLYEIEFNDQFEFATLVPAGTPAHSTGFVSSATGGTNKENDVDWYKISPAKSRYSIEFVRPESLTTTKVEIYYQNPNIASNKVGQIFLSPANGQHASVDLATKVGGYFLRVENSDTDGSNYELRITNRELEGQNYELEPNADRISANELEIGDAVYGNLWHPTEDSDWYKLNLPERGILALTLKAPSITDKLIARVYDSGGTEYGSFALSPGVGDAGYFDANLASGDYYIEVAGETNKSPEAYQPLHYTLSSMIAAYAEYQARSAEPPNAIVDVIGVGDELTVSIDLRDLSFDLRNLSFELGKMINGTIQPLPNFEPVVMEVERAALPVKDGAGTYVGKYVVAQDMNISDGFVLIEMRADNEAMTEPLHSRIVLEPPITIDTLPPKVTEVWHNGDSQHPFSTDEELKVRVVSEPGCEGKFMVKRAASVAEVAKTSGGSQPEDLLREELYDDGQHDDENPDDGVYGGKYVVTQGDNVAGAKLTVWLEDQAGNKTEEIEARKAVFIDTVPPTIEQINYEIIREEEEGETSSLYNTLHASDVLKVMLTGEKECRAEFDLGEMKKEIKLFDDGTRGDEKIGDGIYTNSYVVRKDDNVDSAVITGRLTDLAGNSAEFESSALISIDTKPPQIASITHDAQDALVKNDVLTVTLEGDANGMATFDIENLTENIPMADNGAGIDTQANDGVYTGIYKVKEKDDVKDATVIGHLVDKGGNDSTGYALDKVTIDAVAPEPITDVNVSDVPDDEGNTLEVIWSASDTADFGRYNVYREASPIKTTVGLIPVKSSHVFEESTATKMQENTLTEIIVPANNVDYYIAVTVVDEAGNESTLGKSSTFGPVQAKDNILLEPVREVEAEDRPDDNGKTLAVTWKPLPLTEEQLKGTERDDFEQYRIYVSTEPLGLSEKLEPVKIDGLTSRDIASADVPVMEDEVDYYVAVTALDENGNESELDVEEGGSTAGPVRSHDEVAPLAVQDVHAIDTLSDSGGSITVSWILSESGETNQDVDHYNIYLDTSKITAISDLEEFVSIPVKEPFIEETENGTDETGTSNIAYIDIETPQDERIYYVAVTAVDSGGNESEIGVSSTAGPVQSVSNRISAEHESTISAGFAPNTKISIPAYTAKEGQMIDIFVPSEEEILKMIDEAEHYLKKSHIDETVDDYLKNTAVHFVPSDLEFESPVEITISYDLPSEIQDVWEDELRIFKLNENRTIARWELVQGTQEVDENNDTVTATIQELGVFRVARLKLPANLSKVVVYPNPFNTLKSSSVTFLNLERNSSIDIYTLNGELVQSIGKTERAEDRATWTGRNSEGVEVAGGLYIYVIKSESNKAVGKILVIR